MTEQRFAAAGLQSCASQRRLIALVLVAGAISLPLPCRPPARARRQGAKAAAGEAVPNYGVVWENGLTRSGQPRSEEGWTWLRRRRVKSVVSFRVGDDVDYARLGFEHVLLLPFKARDEPKDGYAEKFLAFVGDRRNWPVHIVCKSGRARTGVMAALVRYAIDGWPLERALAEARSYREGEDLTRHHVAWLRRWAADHAPGSHRLALPGGRSSSTGPRCTGALVTARAMLPQLAQAG